MLCDVLFGGKQIFIYLSKIHIHVCAQDLRMQVSQRPEEVHRYIGAGVTGYL